MRDAQALMARLGLTCPIFQAPMAGVATPALAAAVSNAGGLGALGLGPLTADTARPLLADLGALTTRPFGVNLFCAPPPRRDSGTERDWTAMFQPLFEALGAIPPDRLGVPFGSSLADPAMLALLLEVRPALVSFHFGLPRTGEIAELKRAGLFLSATATSLKNALAIEAAGLDAVVVQGIEAGGHRGVFDPAAEDGELGTHELVRLIAPRLSIPVLAAGGLMDGRDIAKMLRAGAAGAQLGSAFLCCPESFGHAAYSAAMLRQNEGTIVTRALTGWPARAIRNRLSAIGADADPAKIPPFPLPLTATRSLALAASAAGQGGFDLLWAGTGMSRGRKLPAAELVRCLAAELAVAMSGLRAAHQPDFGRLASR
jgi:nitronate monooxygenase